MSTQHPTIDLYVRADAPIPRRRTALIDRLERLDRRELISNYAIHSWPRAMSLALERAVENESVFELVRSVEQWAQQHGIRVWSPFELRTVQSDVTGETDEFLVLPVCCLVARTDDGLLGVSPCDDGETHCSIDDALDALDRGCTPPLWQRSTEPRSDSVLRDSDVATPLTDADADDDHRRQQSTGEDERTQSSSGPPHGP